VTRIAWRLTRSADLDIAEELLTRQGCSTSATATRKPTASPHATSTDSASSCSRAGHLSRGSGGPLPVTSANLARKVEARLRFAYYGAMATAYGNPRPLRADAERNRALIVAAARGRVRRAGSRCPAQEIAAQAGVGIATLYRRFPARENLIAACFETRFADYVKSGVGARGGHSMPFWVN
jgi:hypothetical protein